MSLLVWQAITRRTTLHEQREALGSGIAARDVLLRLVLFDLQGLLPLGHLLRLARHRNCLLIMSLLRLLLLLLLLLLPTTTTTLMLQVCSVESCLRASASRLLPKRSTGIDASKQ